MGKHSQLPLSGVNVIDFGQYIAGPAVAMILADLGATVVHIDPPDGPLWDSPANAVLNRNKLCVKLDLKSPSGLEHAREMIATADIVIENFRPGVLARLGLDFSELRRERPSLITLSIPGFATNDELRRDWRASEAIIASASGVFTDMGQNRVLMGINPSFSPLPLASAYGTMLAASSVMLALQSRQRTGLGDEIEVPLAAAVMEGLSYNSIKIDGYPLRYKTLREKEIERRRAENLPMNLSYEDLQEYLDPFYRTYECADGRKFYAVCPSHRSHAKRCLQTMGLYDEMIAAGLPKVDDPYLPLAEWEGDASLGVYPLPEQWAKRISKRMKEVFLTKTAAEWEMIFGEGQFPGAPHRSTQEWLHDEHANAAGLIVEVVDKDFGVMKQPGPMAWLEDSGHLMLEPASRRDVSIEEALATLSEVPRDELPAIVPQAPGAWLHGVRILDLTNVIAGPHSTSFLGRFGAEVIKLDPTTPNYDPWNTVVFGMSSARGKQSVLVDLNQPAGREVFDRLVKTVDVIVMNAPDRQLAPLGLDETSLKSINPQVIFCQLDCFGGPRRGPRTDYLGYDDLIQATTGIMVRFGGGMQTPEEHAHVGTIDVMCGFAAALGVGAALYQKSRIGKVSRARTSLAALGNLVQVPFCFDYKGRREFDEPSGRSVMGYSDLSRFYQTSDGWLYLDAREVDLVLLDTVTGLVGIDQAPDKTAFLTEALAKAAGDIWQQRLQAVGIAAAVPDNIDNLRQRYSRAADGLPGTANGSYSFSVYADHPSGHRVTQLDPFAIRPRLAPIRALRPAEKFGASTRAVMLKLGYSPQAIEALMANQVISDTWSLEYLPS
ncbi:MULTISPECIES: CoA transferase [unclassified Pseudomonas]|uniref:CoA transferase n=1 Tax=unclassified Pseudomonas TaxID=196821 RepID=UPI000D333859|nr:MULTISPECIES: CoA transferase [unclassified Pseudomonas]RAU47901.1 carnitine dehydratase [Pseudomonas sp. RIT 409]RAU55405.1 carnitine dehydratase [Pseudomonas sp. RIT 412]